MHAIAFWYELDLLPLAPDPLAPNGDRIPDAGGGGAPAAGCEAVRAGERGGDGRAGARGRGGGAAASRDDGGVVVCTRPSADERAAGSHHWRQAAAMLAAPYRAVVPGSVLVLDVSCTAAAGVQVELVDVIAPP